MSNARADRRRQGRGGAQPPGRRRDPMMMLYIGLAIAVVAIFAAFGIARWNANRLVAIASATPTPGPNANMKPIQLVDQGALGEKSFPIGNSMAGGLGKPVDDIPCESMEGQGLHVHTHLTLFVNGKQIQIPQDIGIVPQQVSQDPTTCLYWLHTHDAEGIIHVESPQTSGPDGGPFTLGEFFDIWGQPLFPNQVGKFKGNVTAYVNGGKYTGELRAIPLLAHQQITLEIGKFVPPPNYTFPPED